MAAKKINAIQQALDTLKSCGVKKAPVDVEKIAKKLGAKVVYSPLDDEHCGMLYMNDDEIIIGVNSLHHPNRQRFTIAHEIGHLVMHKDEFSNGVHIDKSFRLDRNKASSNGEVGMEIEANQFAAELLMPAKLLEKEFADMELDVEDDEAISSLAEKYKVSNQAMSLKVGKILGDFY